MVSRAAAASACTRIVELLGRPLSGQIALPLLDEATNRAVRLPQGTFAAMLGVHRPALNRALKNMERQDLIEIGYAEVRISQRRRMEQLASMP